MNKKLIYAIGLSTIMAACSSEGVLTDVQNPQELDMFAGIEKVDAELNLGLESRLNTQWGIEIGDRVGFAWLKDLNEKLELSGVAYQNHPLNAVSTSTLKPATSIYEGEYYVYTPYDYSVVSIENINFAIPEDQDMQESYNGLAKNAIFISPKWTTVSNNIYDEGEPGINKTFKIYPRQFSSIVGLDFAYTNNKVDLKDETDNDAVTVGDPEIMSVEVSYLDAENGNVVSVKKFQYAPTEETNAENWNAYVIGEDMDVLAATTGRAVTLNSVNGVNVVEKGAYSLKPTATYVAGRAKDGDQFMFNALPAQTEVGNATHVKFVVTTTYGVITYVLPVNETAMTYGGDGYKEYFDGVTVDPVSEESLKAEDCTDYTESFVQVLGKTGKFVVEIDFCDAVMDGMHVRDNAHLLQLLRYFRDYKMGNEYEETGVTLWLDETNGEFEISKEAIALLQSINGSSTKYINLKVCKTHGAPAVVIENNGTDIEVPSFGSVFGETVDVNLKDQAWTWNNDAKVNTGRVATIYNRGDLEINAKTVVAGNKIDVFTGLVNKKGASIVVKSVANVKINLTNMGAIAVKENAELLAYGSTIVNEAVSLNELGTIDNDGVIGVVKDTEGVINNYGYIHNGKTAKTYITANQTENASFSSAWSATNKIGTIELSDKFDNISVSNSTTQGFIKYTWDGTGAYVTPTPEVDVKYNYLIVKNNVEFTEVESEISYLEIANTGSEIVITSEGANKVFEKPNRLKGFIMASGAKANIKKGNTVRAAAAYIANGKLYVGGEFSYDKLDTYLGGVAGNKDNIVEY